MKTEWPEVRLRDTGTFIQIGPFGSLLHQSDYVLGGIPLVNPTHIVAGRIQPGDRETVAPASLARLSRYLLKSGDVVMGRRGEMGRCAVVDSGTEGFLCGSGSLIMRPDPSRLSSEFLQAYISSPAGRAKLERVAQGVTMLNLNGDIVGDLEIPVPPIEEQRRIAAILSTAERLQECRRSTIALLDALAHAVFRRMFGWMPTCEAKTLGDLGMEFRYGTSHKSADVGGVRCLRIPDVVRGVASLTDLVNVPVSSAELERLRLRAGDVLFVRSNGNPDYVGRCAAITDEIGEEPLIFASYLIRGRLPDGPVRAGYLQFALSSAEGRRQMRANASTTAGQYNINTVGLSTVRVAVPPLDQQLGFERTISTILRRRDDAVRSLALLASMSAALQHRAFAGTL